MKKSRRIIRAIALTTTSLALVGISLFATKGNAKQAYALGGSGTEDNPYIISTAAELEEVMSDVDSGKDYKNEYLLITNDLSINLAATTNGKTFRGHLDGDNHTITLSTSATGTVAMFNCVGSTATVSNIKFEGTISGVGQRSSTVCAWNYGTISNVINNCQLTSTDTNGYLGGIAGSQIDASATIDNCINNASISGVAYVGGIVGNLRVGTISNSINKGNITSSSNACAGIAGLVGSANNSTFDAIINNCVNEGDISGTGQIGGIVGGLFPQLTCSNCSNYGNISASSNSGVGGIAGLINSTVSTATFSFTNCYSSGTVTTNAGWAGGIFGYASSGSYGTIDFTNVLSASKINNTSSTGNVGGFMAGQNSKNAEFNLEKCQSIASVAYTGTGAFSTGIAISATNIVKNIDSNLAVNDKKHGLELSNTTIALLRAIREFHCEHDSTMASIVSIGVNSLTSDEIELLDLTVHYGANNYIDTYYRSALYIKAFLTNGINGSNRIISEANFSENSTIIIFISGVFAVTGFTFLLLLKKRKNNQ